MRKIFYLSSCSTCKRIMGAMDTQLFELQDIKEKNIDAETLDFVKNHMGSYEAIFSKRAMKYRSLGLNTKDLTETDFKDWILKEYTFLKRPVVIHDDQVYVGSTKKMVESLQKAFPL